MKMNMNMKVFNTYSCDTRFKCIYSACCNLETFQQEILVLNITSLSIFIFLSFVFSYFIIKNNKKRKDEFSNSDNSNHPIHNHYLNRSQSFMHHSLEEINLNMSLSFNNGQAQSKVMSLSERPSSFSYGNIMASIFIKCLLLHLILMKLLEIIVLDNQFILGDISFYPLENISKDQGTFISDNYLIKITFFSVLEFLILIFSFSILFISGQFLEFFKRYLLISVLIIFEVIYNFSIYFEKSLLLYKIYLINATICGFIVFLIIILSINSNSILFAKLNREESVSESNYHKDIIKNYSRHLPEDDSELYKETNRVFDMYKVLEIVEKIRMNRKQILNVGLLFIFILLIVTLFFNVFMFIRNFNQVFLYTNNSLRSNDIFNELNNLEYLSDFKNKKIRKQIIKQRVESGKYPNNVIMVLIDNVDQKRLNENEEYKDFIQYLTKKEKSARIYKIKSEGLSVPSWVSYFTGTNKEFNGLKGNILNLPYLTNFDSIFRRMKRNGINNSIIGRRNKSF
jgi:hypothetical protein